MKPSSHTFGLSPLKKYTEAEIDPYSTAIVEDLLQGQSDWKNISDTVRLTVKALTDVVRAQGETIREFEKQIPTRASKSELHTGLSLKANINDVSRTIAEVASSLDSKVSFEDVQTVLKDHVLKSDLQYLLNSKVSIDEIRQIIERQGGVGLSELKTEVEIFKNRVEDFQRDVIKRIGGLPSLKDLSQITQAIDMKANLQEVNEALETKASKQSVQSALSKKVNRQDLEEKLQQYATLQDVQPIIEQLEQKASIDQIEKVAQILEVKVDRADFTILINSVQGKAEHNDLEMLREQINDFRLQQDQRFGDTLTKTENFRHELEEIRNSCINTLAKKADSKDFDRLQQTLGKRSGESELINNHLTQMRQEMYNELNRLKDELLQQKQFQSEQLQSTILKSSHLSEKLTEELYNLSEQVRSNDEERRIDCEDLRKLVARLTQMKKEQSFKFENLFEEFDGVKKFIDEAQTRYSTRKDLNEFKAKIISQLDERVGINEVQKVFTTSHSDIGSKLNSFKDELRNEMKILQNEMYAHLQKKVNHQEFQTFLQSKADIQVVDLAKTKVSQQDFDELKKIVHKICLDQDERITLRDFSQHIHFTKNVLDMIQKDMLLKANIKDVCTLVDSKSNIEDVNVALTQIHKELENRSSYDDLNAIVKKQASLNDSLCEENIVARFQWRSGELKSGNTVPWEFQVVNTLTDNYIWEKDKSSILTVAPGVYQICYGFYAKKKPNIQFLVNGEPIITRYQQNNPLQNSTAVQKSKDQHKHSQGNITGFIAHKLMFLKGVTDIDFIVLPARARISIIYDGDAAGEGFLSLKRL